METTSYEKTLKLKEYRLEPWSWTTRFPTLWNTVNIGRFLRICGISATGICRLNSFWRKWYLTR